MWSELPGVPRSCAGGVLAGMVSADPCCVFTVAVACQSNPVRPTRPERPPERSSARALVRLPMFHPVEILNEWATRTNRLRGDAPRVDDYAQRWLDDGGPSRAVFEPLPASPRLMIVLTTYQRPHGAAHVLERLAAALARADLSERAALLVLHDAGDADYRRARTLATTCAERVHWLSARVRFGKPGFWQVYQTALLVARAWQPEQVLFLQDDVDFTPDLLLRAQQIWRATADDPLRRVLYLFASRDDEPRGRWVSFPRRELPAHGCRQTNWFDLQAFLVDREFLQLLDYRLVPIHPNRWLRQPSISSGVGRQLTLRAFRRANVYQAWPPLVRHGADPSTMNPDARKLRPLDNRSD